MTFRMKVDDEIQLELLEDKQAESLFELVDDARDHLAEWLPWVEDTQQVSDTETFIRTSRAKFGNNTVVPAGIRFRDELCGHTGLHIDGDVAEIGYWLHKDWEGNGIVTRAARKLTSYGFQWRDLHRIEIRAAPDNEKSWAIPERLGYTLDGTLREVATLYDDRVDLRVYSMLADEWEPDATVSEVSG